MAPTMTDVAQKAKVSQSTVSMVMSNTGNISTETASKVMAAAKELGYARSKLHKSSRRSSSMTIVVGFRASLYRHMSANPTYIDILRGIEEESSRQRVSVIVRSVNSESHGQEMAGRTNGLTDFQQGKSRGAILLGHPSEELLETFTHNHIPFVAIEAQEGQVQTNVVMPDHYAAGYLATDYLAKLGHRHIAYAGAPTEFISIRKQILGYRDALHKAGIDSKDALVIHTPLQDNEALSTGKDVAQRILAMNKKPTAVIMGGEVDAADTLNILQNNGLVVPRDISLIASGSSAMPICRATHPTLTNVCCASDARLGELAVKRLIDIIKDPNQPVQKALLGIKLVEGESTAKHKSSNQFSNII